MQNTHEVNGEERRWDCHLTNEAESLQPIYAIGCGQLRSLRRTLQDVNW